jgi:type III secretory pathway component EscV
MTSKKYFTIACVFMALYIVSSLGVIAGLPDWVHQICTVVFAGAIFLYIRQKKIENLSDKK